jgi:hypothetical protein
LRIICWKLGKPTIIRVPSTATASINSISVNPAGLRRGEGVISICRLF